ncbi:YhcH/YjgK/YiaL family protein [Halosquirtibacter laminarini]|uniref:YhcH/YjgK/YiaL family protein n=1 Tax=Halosquirtibacter laminarini TaxID=3374600 RepID=A0AC61NI69_9BACT|nr:YhcH/YjgK/YiaL family protein [Prolixibacteraceae bacterium]
MALFGILEEVAAQAPSQELITKGIDFLKQADLESYFSKVENGSSYCHEIQGKDLFASFQIYQTKQPEVPNFEGHKKYIDIQFVYEGEELIYNGATTNSFDSIEYDSESDFYLAKVSSFSTIKMGKGDAAILFPTDLHAPCQCAGEKPVLVKKIVVKVAVK